MSEPQPRAPEPAWQAPRVREIARLSLDFALDISRISRGAGDLLDPLLLTAILDANQAQVHRDPELARRYGDAQTALPNAHRRPISVNALAKSLRLPFETVRRRVGGWVKAGVCVRTPAGVYVPAEVVTSPAYIATQVARVERLAAFQTALVRAGFLVPATLEGPAPPWGVRAADRALAQYMLRTCDQLIALAGSPVTGFVLLGLGVAGLEPGAARRRTQPVAAICSHIGMPAETVRRHLLALEELGLARHGQTGWTSAAAPDTWPRLSRLMAHNEANLRRLFERLAELQVERQASA